MPTDTTLDRDTINQLYARYGLMPIGGGSQEDDDAGDDDQPDDDGENENDLPADLGDKGKEALKAERKKARDAVKRARDLETELETLRKAKEDADAAKAKADEEEATRKGEFEKLATERAETIKAVTGERDSLKTRLDQAEKLLKTSVDERWKDVPEEVAELYEGDADDPLAKLSFIDKNAKVIAALKAKDEAEQNKYKLASGTRTPSPDPTGKPELPTLVKPRL